MKKVICMILCVVMALSVVGCTSEKPEDKVNINEYGQEIVEGLPDLPGTAEEIIVNN